MHQVATRRCCASAYPTLSWFGSVEGGKFIESFRRLARTCAVQRRLALLGNGEGWAKLQGMPRLAATPASMLNYGRRSAPGAGSRAGGFDGAVLAAVAASSIFMRCSRASQVGHSRRRAHSLRHGGARPRKDRYRSRHRRRSLRPKSWSTQAAHGESDRLDGRRCRVAITPAGICCVRAAFLGG